MRARLLTIVAAVTVVCCAGIALVKVRVGQRSETKVSARPAVADSRAAPVPVPPPGAENLRSFLKRAETDEQKQERIRRFGAIPLADLERARPILDDYLRLEMDLRRKNPNEWMTVKTRRLIMRERLFDLQKVLTPQEAEDIDLHLEPSAINLLDSLKYIALTETEERAILRLNRRLAEELEAHPGATGFRYRAEMAMFEEIRGILGEERFVRFISRHDVGYKRFVAVTEEQGQPRAVAEQLWRMKNEFFIRRSDSYDRLKDDPAALRGEVDALAAEMRARATALVGDRALRESPAPVFDWLPPAGR